MLRLLLPRLLQSVVILLGVTLVVSSLIKLIPGDPVDIISAGDPSMTVEDLDRLREQMGLNRSVFEHYIAYLGGAVQGDLGTSLRQHMPVADLVLERVPATAELAFWAMVFGLVLAVPLGVVTALKRGSWVDYGGTVVAVLGVSTPSFLLAVMMILWFSVDMRMLPASGYRGSALGALFTLDFAGFVTTIRYFLLPAISLSFVLVAVNARLIRSAMLEVLEQDYITFATAKGVPRMVIILRHALRNALLPVVTMLGLQVGSLLSGTVVIENVFAWPGIGRLAVDAIHNRDYAVIQGVVLISAVLFIALNLVVDGLYRIIDPRVGS
ncbi:ABC transporter permease [Chachezhania sediminis]|uniref:ABC transporter permease n=1 Tax=Chachezhania sediminis TaxID=2599291 RepID=UPI0018EEEF45|nr:ABC transporter permease [Chachezhania sediminis]